MEPQTKEITLYFLEISGETYDSGSIESSFYCFARDGFTVIIDRSMIDLKNINYRYPKMKIWKEAEKSSSINSFMNHAGYDLTENQHILMLYFFIERFGKLHRLPNIKIDPNGSQLYYYVLKSKNDLISILVFQEDSQGNMQQLTDKPDWNLEYKIIYNGKFNPTYPSPYQLKPEVNARNAEILTSIRDNYTGSPRVLGKIIIGDTFIEQMLGQEIDIPITGDLSIDVRLFSGMSYDQINHLVRINKKIYDIVNTKEFLVQWLIANNYPWNISSDYYRNIPVIDFLTNLYMISTVLNKYGIIQLENNIPPKIKINYGLIHAFIVNKQPHMLEYFINLFDVDNAVKLNAIYDTEQILNLIKTIDKSEYSMDDEVGILHIMTIIMDNLTLEINVNTNVDPLFKITIYNNYLEIFKYLNKKFPDYVPNNRNSLLTYARSIPNRSNFVYYIETYIPS